MELKMKLRDPFLVCKGRVVILLKTVEEHVMEFACKTVYDHKTLAVMYKALRRTMRKKPPGVSGCSFWGWLFWLWAQLWTHPRVYGAGGSI